MFAAMASSALKQSIVELFELLETYKTTHNELQKKKFKKEKSFAVGK